MSKKYEGPDIKVGRKGIVKVFSIEVECYTYFNKE